MLYPTFPSSRYAGVHEAYRKTTEYKNPIVLHTSKTIELRMGSHDIPDSFEITAWCGIRDNQPVINFKIENHFPFCAECIKLMKENEQAFNEHLSKQV